MPENSQALFEKLFLEYRDKVYRLCFSYTRNETLAEDLLQESFSKIWMHLENFEGRSDVGTWIYRIVANICLMQLRDLQKTRLHYQEVLKTNVVEEQHPDVEEQSAALFKAINQLKETDRLIISMVLEDLPQKQIGEILGITENNVNIKVHRIKKQLKELILKNQ